MKESAGIATGVAPLLLILLDADFPLPFPVRSGESRWVICAGMTVVDGEDLSGRTEWGGGGLIAGGGGVGSFVGVVVVAPSAEAFEAAFVPRPIERLRGRLGGVGDTSADGFIDTTRDLLGVVAKVDFDSGDRARDALTLLVLVLATLLDAAERSEPATLPAGLGGVPLLALVAPTPDTRLAAKPGACMEGEGLAADPGCCCAAMARC